MLIYQHVSVLPIMGGKWPKYSRCLEPIFGQSRSSIADILLVLTFTDTDSRYFKKCQYIGSTNISVNRYAIPALVLMAWSRKNEAGLIFLVLGHNSVYLKKNEAQASLLTLIFWPPCHTLASFFLNHALWFTYRIGHHFWNHIDMLHYRWIFRAYWID